MNKDNVELVIKIPGKEFGLDIGDKFQDFFSRLKAEIKEHLITNTNLVCGALELETIDMLLNAFKNGIPLPKGHSDLIDRNDLLADSYCIDAWSGEEVNIVDVMTVKMADAIIEADKSETEG